MVIWTRHRRLPDLTPRIRAWFTDAGFDEVAFDILDTTALTGGWGRPAPPSLQRWAAFRDAVRLPPDMNLSQHAVSGNSGRVEHE